MIGKGALLIVLGFISAFSVYQLKLTRTSVNATDNFNSQYERTLTHESALSAMNMGVTEVWDKKVTDSTFMVVLNNCSTSVSIASIGLDTVRLKSKSWRYVFDEETYRSSQTAQKIQDSVVAYFTYSTPISHYFWFTNQEGFIYWITGDTVWGPMHTNDVLRTSGSPVFYGKVTAKMGINPLPGAAGNDAKYYGGWEIGVDSSIPTDMSPLIAAANAGNGGAPTNTKSIYNTVTTFDFQSDGNVIRTVGSNPPDTVALSDIAPTGVIYSSDDIRVKGSINGQVTLYSDQHIWIDDDIVCADDPTTNPNSDDYIGLVADNDVIITDNAANNSDVNIQAALMAINGKMYAEHYDTRPVAGALRITGSIVQNQRGAIGTFSWWTGNIVSGFSKRYRFDPRFSIASPPYYPYVRALRLISWWE